MSDATKKTITNRRCVAIDFYDTSRPQLGIQYAFNDTWISLRRKHARIVRVHLCVSYVKITHCVQIKILSFPILLIIHRMVV